jgi:glucose/arabinose dehydrogenase
VPANFFLAFTRGSRVQNRIKVANREGYRSGRQGLNLDEHNSSAMNLSKKSHILGFPVGSLLGSALLQLLLFVVMMSATQAGIQAVRVASGFTLPLWIGSPPRDTTRLFVAEQHGMIKIIDRSTGTVLPTPFLDITNEVGQGQGTGILGMTFDPNYATNGYFYVSYTTNGGGVFHFGVSHIARFTVTSDPNVADRSSEVTVITVDQTQHDHNLDWIGFSNRPGDTNNLYICSGDGGHIEDKGPGHQPEGNAQSLVTNLGKILRIHIEADGSYTIPADNPFVGSDTAKQEIWAYGVRNPFRASFDRKSGDMFIGDVGEALREEVDVNSHTNPGGGQNFGWRVREGLIQNPAYSEDPPPPNAVDPIMDYEHATTGICVIGGYVYRGRTVQDLQGLYVFGDCFGPADGDFTGRIFTMKYQRGVASAFTDITSQLFPTQVGGYTLNGLTSFGEDPRGEIFLTDLAGDVFQITKAN